MKLFKIGLGLALGLLITGCTAYQDTFGGRGHRYEGAIELKPINMPSNALSSSPRYRIPKVAKSWQGVPSEIVPPDFKIEDNPNGKAE